MKNVKKLIIIILIIIAILVIAILGIKAVKLGGNDRTRNLYNEISSKNGFTFSMEEIGSEVPYKLTITQKDGNLNIDTVSEDEHGSTLILNGHAYYINHNNKEYYDYGDDEIDEENIVLKGLKETNDKDYQTGKENIEGKEYYYEEYNDITSFLILLDAFEDATFKTRFYYDGDKLVYIKNIVDQNGQTTDELIKTNLDYNVDQSSLEIPSDYAEMAN